MSYQIYFLQNEDDAIQFLDKLLELNAIVWTESVLTLPNELKDDIVRRMSSSMFQYVIVPSMFQYSIQSNIKEQFKPLTGIDFLICCKKAKLSRTYEVGRIYYSGDDSDYESKQMFILYNKIKSFIKKNYFYDKNARIYVAPQFKQKYAKKQLHASQLGRSIILNTCQ